MPGISIGGWVALLATVGVSACTPQGSAQLSEADVAAVHQVEQAFVQRVLDGEWDAAVEYFADDAVRMPFNAPLERGRATIRAHFDAVDSITQWTIHDSEVGGDGNVAYLRQAYTITAFLAGMPGAATYTGKSLAVLRRQPDGRWLFVMDIWNADAPLHMPQ